MTRSWAEAAKVLKELGVKGVVDPLAGSGHLGEEKHGQPRLGWAWPR